MSLTQILESERTKEPERQGRRTYESVPGRKPELFSRQYLEKPVISGDYKMAVSPTASSFKGIPVIDDF